MHRSNRLKPESSLLILPALITALLLSGCPSNPPTATSTAANPPPAAPPSVPPQQGDIRPVSNTQLQTLLDQGVTLVDIRRPEEWRETGIVPGSKLLTLFDANGNADPHFFRTVTTIVPTSQPIALICRSGNRTQVASQMLARSGGYATVYPLSNGILGWQAEGRPLVAAP
ncbi:MAG: rhodanese-like domain-containing protein [Thiolinea sp.]